MTFMVTATGVEFNLSRPRPDAVQIADIAHHLATSTRFNGATLRPYSIAEHSLLVCEICERDGLRDPSALLAALLHDAHEAYLGDIIHPVKWWVGRVDGGALHVLESTLEHVVRKRFDLFTASTAYREAIRRADLVALATERRDLLPPTPGLWAVLSGIEPIDWGDLHGREAWTWQDWRRAFLDRFDELSFARQLRAEAFPCAEPSASTRRSS